MRLIFSIVYIIYFGIQSYYTILGGGLDANIMKLWGKVWSTSHDVMTMFLAFIIWLGWHDITIRKAAFVAGIYQVLMLVFDICWINEWVRTDNKLWTLAFFTLIFIMNFILISNGRYTKK